MKNNSTDIYWAMEQVVTKRKYLSFELPLLNLSARTLLISPSCRFLGEEAKFPMGPFILAMQREVPIITVFVMKESVKHYKVFIKKIELTKEECNYPTKRKIECLAKRYAEHLEYIIREYPTQWFNYFEFWEQ